MQRNRPCLRIPFSPLLVTTGDSHPCHHYQRFMLKRTVASSPRSVATPTLDDQQRFHPRPRTYASGTPALNEVKGHRAVPDTAPSTAARPVLTDAEVTRR